MSQYGVNNKGLVPGYILKGKSQKYLSVHTIFLNTFIQEYLRRVYESYDERSHLDQEPNMKWGTKADSEGPKQGRPDNYGDFWDQLRPKTYRSKAKGNKAGAYAEYLETKTSRAAKSIVNRIRNANHLSGDHINIRTGRMLASFFPGPLVNNQIVKTEDQNIVLEGINIHFDNNNIDYADTAMDQFNRPIISDNEPTWIEESFEIATNAAANEYQRIKSRNSK